MISVRHIPGFDPFCEAYIRAALFSSTDEDGRPLDRIYTPASFRPEALDAMMRDCAKFLYQNARFVGERYKEAGADFWLTRNRSGAGFWDGDWPEPAATKLTDAAHAFGEQSVLQDGLRLIVFSG